MDDIKREAVIANMFLSQANESIVLGDLTRATSNLKFATKCNATAEDVANVKNKIKMAEAKQSLNKAQHHLFNEDFLEAKKYLMEAKTFELLMEDRLKLEEQLSLVEEAKIYFHMTHQNVIKRDTASVQKNFDQLENALRNLDKNKLSSTFLRQINELRKEVDELTNADKFTLLAIDNMNQGLFTEAKQYLSRAKEHDLPFHIALDIENQIKCAQLISKAEEHVSKGNFLLAQCNLEHAEILFNYPREEAIKYQKIIEDSQITKDNTPNNDIANREPADYCLKSAKNALEDKDMAKAEILATKADKIYPSVVRPKDDCKISSNSYNNKENTANNDIAKREQADYCLKIAKTALEDKDIAKAERLATKADRMYPSEEAKTLLAKISRIKSSVKDREVKTEITNYSTINREDPIEAQKCLEIAFTAFSKDNVEKCKRFLKKANTFDKSINIDVYMTDLQQKKARKELEIEMKKARDENEMQLLKNRDTDYASKACNAVKNTARSVFGNAYPSYNDCLHNKTLSPETKKSCEKISIGDSAASFQFGNNTHGDSATKTSKGKDHRVKTYCIIKGSAGGSKSQNTEMVSNNSMLNKNNSETSEGTKFMAKYLRDMGVNAFNCGQYEEAEEFLMKSEDLVPNYVTRNMLNATRVALNEKAVKQPRKGN